MNKRIKKKKGFSKIQNSELWDLDYTIIKFILPRLKKFKEINISSYPTKCGNIELFIATHTRDFSNELVA